MIFNSNVTELFNRNRTGKANRPLVRPEMGPLDWILEAAALTGLMILLGFVIYKFPRLPEIIPSHFNGAGMPDDYSPKSSIWILPGVAAFIYVLLSLIALVPNQFNFTVIITPSNALKQYTFAIRLIRYLKAAIIWMFFYISYTTARGVVKEDPGLGVWFLPVVLGGLFIPLIIYFIAASRHR